MAKAQYIPQLLRLFRQHGYDGATLARISEATGLGKASLYHHFPGGKDEMVEAVLAHLKQATETHIIQVLQGDGDAQTRLRTMCEGIDAMYQKGEQPCLLAILLMGSSRDVFRVKVKQLLQCWIDEIATVLITEGVTTELAHQRAEDAVLSIQGSLILSQGLEDCEPFRRVIKHLPQQLCRDFMD